MTELALLAGYVVGGVVFTSKLPNIDKAENEERFVLFLLWPVWLLMLGVATLFHNGY